MKFHAWPPMDDSIDCMYAHFLLYNFKTRKHIERKTICTTPFIENNYITYTAAWFRNGSAAGEQCKSNLYEFHRRLNQISLCRTSKCNSSGFANHQCDWQGLWKYKSNKDSNVILIIWKLRESFGTGICCLCCSTEHLDPCWHRNPNNRLRDTA